MKLLIKIIMGIVILSPFAFAVSVVGGGRRVVSTDSLFQSEIPEQVFYDIREFNDKSLRMSAVPIFRNGFISVQVLNLREFNNSYPELINADRQEVTEYFVSRQWQVAEHLNSCISLYVDENVDGYYAVAAWGGGKGLVLSGSNTYDIRNAVKYILDRIELSEGACGWK